MPLPDPTVTALVLAIASLIKGTFGFGDALLAMPVLTLLFGPQEAAPLAAGAGLVSTLWIVIADRVAADWRAAGRLIVGATLGVPLGIAALRWLPTEALMVGLGALLIVYGLRGLRPQRGADEGAAPLGTDRTAPVFGLASGFLGGALTVGGPPVVIYAALRRWPPGVTRATLAGFFLPNAVMVLAGQIAGGLWDEQTLRRLSLALPGVLAATWLGGRLNRRVPAARFQRLLYGLLIVMGALLLQASAA